MNAIIDLTARAVSFITAIQTSLLRGLITPTDNNTRIPRTRNTSIMNILPEEFKSTLNRIIELEEKDKLDEHKSPEEESFSIRAFELVWVSEKEVDVNKAVDYAITLCASLHQWIWDNWQNGIIELLKNHGEYPSPFNWREAITAILYRYPEERVRLASALQYMPIQVVLALGCDSYKTRSQQILQMWKSDSYEARSQRILQMWKISDHDQQNLLNTDEITELGRFKKLEKESDVTAELLLKDEDKLFAYLLETKVPLSFEDVFRSELIEIRKNRTWRNNEMHITGSSEVMETTDNSPVQDPFQKGREMGLYALTFSGGGIRSATFNLGILQGLANHNLVTRFDYLSTVSGGGYIGSWLAAWIKRDGSVVKVTNRLCTYKSPEPSGEELKPIRWLRMYSNYLAPRSSIMSADVWTVGITWLRNTLLNQIIIFLLLLSLLFTGNLLYAIWRSDIAWKNTSWPYVLGWSVFLLIPVSLLAGLGMYAYNHKDRRSVGTWRKHTNKISKGIIFISMLAAYLLSAWIHSRYSIHMAPGTLSYKINILFPSAVVTFFALSLVAVLGDYAQCIRSFGNNTFVAWLILIVTALISTAIGLFSLVAVWSVFENIETAQNSFVVSYKNQLQFILGLPLVLEVFSITVVARMALLGKYFPDERREWWGRMGAYLHRIAFIWILIAASALLGKEFISFLFSEWWAGMAATGGWVALVGTTVKAAFSSDTSDKEEKKSPLTRFLNVLSLTGPYLFALGLLIFLPGLIDPILGLASKAAPLFGYQYPKIFLREHINLVIFCVILITVLAAYFLARQVGVNEFSLYHFYRNRLVRAYLGATRRSTDRQQTSNPFTGFDNLDDEKLHKMQHDFGYHGPYPVLNTTLNASQVADLDRQDRMAESFIFSPLYCGFDFSLIKASADVKAKSYDYAFRQTQHYAFKDGGPSIGTAMATSGAAVSPNKGYHSSAATSFLLTVFNVQTGRWIGNPRKSTWQLADPGFGLWYIINNLIGKTNTRNKFIALSDGGHFDNMGLYEMVRRRCSFIIVCDAEQDDQFTCEGFANAIRRCRIDFGAEIDINISGITKRTNGRFSAASYALGDITYATDKEPSGKLLYIKSSITDNDLPVDVQEYALKNKTFPHQTTGDQFFDEEQFESYRKLGLYIADRALKDGIVKKAFRLPE